jgi:hypothetical protein
MAIFARIGRLFRGFLNLFVSGLEARNPEALMEAARQDFRDKMARYNTALAQMAWYCRAPQKPDQGQSQRAQEPRAPHPGQPPRRQYGAGGHSRESCRN